MERNNLGTLYTQAFRKYWDQKLFTDYGGADLKYKEIAQSVQALKVIFEKAGLKPGDKVAIYGRNSTNWAKVFLGTMAYGIVAVPVLPDFIPESVHHIIEHSESKFLFAAKSLYASLDPARLKDIEGCIAIEDFSVLQSKNENLKNLSAEGIEMIHKAQISKDDFFFVERDNEELQILSYTSGS